nr:twin-arginine translocase subunit TatC [Ardenticatena sp.]
MTSKPHAEIEETADVYDGEAKPLVEHLRELRTRLFRAVAFLLLTTMVSVFAADRFLQILTKPLLLPPQAIRPTETIIVYFKVALIMGLAIAMPEILYEIIAFVTPGLTRKEKRYLFFFLPAAALLFIAGVAFGAFVALPAALGFLQQFGKSFAEIQWTLDSYISFVTTFLLWLGLGFQTPLVIFTLAKLNIVQYETLKKNIRWAVLIAAILAAMITPTPDPFNMMIVAVPLFFLYVFGVFLARFA